VTQPAPGRIPATCIAKEQPMRHILSAAAILSLAACTPGTSAPVSAGTVSTVLADVQLFCQVGPLVSAMATSIGGTAAPVIARGASSAYVRAICAAVGGIAVSPPAAPGAAPVLVIPAAAIPLRP